MTAAAPLARLVDLLRCVRPADSGICHGSLEQTGEGELCCKRCGVRYPLIRDVPVVKPDREAAELRWFDESYTLPHHARQVQIDSPYLRPQRALFKRLAEEWRLKGPCLEIGCGTGIFAEYVPDYVGIEYSSEALLSQGFEAYSRVCADARDLPFPDAAFELVFSFNTIEHIDAVDRVYREIDRVLKPGGYLLLKPSWHVPRYQTELVPVRPYKVLNLRQKAVKFLLPVLRSKPYKLATWLPWRLWRRLTARANNPLRWGRLVPYHGTDWIADADACSSIDIHETALYFVSRGYACLSHPSAVRQLVAGHDVLVLRKGRGAGAAP